MKIHVKPTPSVQDLLGKQLYKYLTGVVLLSNRNAPSTRICVCVNTRKRNTRKLQPYGH